MAYITVITKDGKKKSMQPHFARALIACGQAVRYDGYETKVLKSEDYEVKSLQASEEKPKRGRKKKVKDEA